MTFPLQDDRNTPVQAGTEPGPVSRRAFISAVAVAALSGCTTRETAALASPAPLRFHEYSAMYGALTDNGETIPTVPIVKLKPEFYRQEVRDPTGMPPGTIVVETSTHFLYLVGEGERALRYGVGLGRAGFAWSGSATIGRKAAWPRWRPPSEMIARLPDLEQYRSRYDAASGQWTGGMEPGIANPLGARALYLYQGGKDTLYRIHGTPEWWTIGTNVSSGCVRMLNQDVIDLYERVPERTPVIVTAALPLSRDAHRIAPAGTASVGSAGAERTITNVATGQLTATSTDAVNGSQLYATNQAVETLQTGVGDLSEFTVRYDKNADGTKANSVTLVGGDPNAPVLLSNVATGVADTDAVNVAPRPTHGGRSGLRRPARQPSPICRAEPKDDAGPTSTGIVPGG